jgi:hypothetical protein
VLLWNSTKPGPPTHQPEVKDETNLPCCLF